MELGKPLAEYGAANIDAVRGKMLMLGKEFWEADRAVRTMLAGNRPGNAVFFYNDIPPFAARSVMNEVRAGTVNVFRQSSRQLYAEIQAVIETKIQPVFPQCNVMRVQLAELPPRQVIAPHIDLGILALIHRLHIPIVTHPDVKFTIAGQSFFLQPGELYDLNNAVRHSVENNSDVMRVHLMVDMLPESLAKIKYYDTEAAFLAAVKT